MNDPGTSNRAEAATKLPKTAATKAKAMTPERMEYLPASGTQRHNPNKPAQPKTMRHLG